MKRLSTSLRHDHPAERLQYLRRQRHDIELCHIFQQQSRTARRRARSVAGPTSWLDQVLAWGGSWRACVSLRVMFRCGLVRGLLLAQILPESPRPSFANSCSRYGDGRACAGAAGRTRHAFIRPPGKLAGRAGSGCKKTSLVNKSCLPFLLRNSCRIACKTHSRTAPRSRLVLVCISHRRLLHKLLLDLHTWSAEHHPRLLVELIEGLVHHRNLWSAGAAVWRGSRLAGACRRRARGKARVASRPVSPTEGDLARARSSRSASPPVSPCRYAPS